MNHPMRAGRWLGALALLMLGGCASLEYYAGLIQGQAELLNRARPIPEVLADDTVRPAVRTALAELTEARRFAIDTLLLPDTGSYRDYADLGRPYAVWNVIAAGRFSVEPRRWCFPVTGCIPYRGYFAAERAQAEAQSLADQGFDVYVAGARAFSTLGWFDDPILNTMLYRDPALRVEILFHEMAHQKLYVPGDGSFNEAFATFVAQTGTERWLREQGASAERIGAYRRRVVQRREFNALLRRTRERLAALYARDLPESAMAAGKRRLFEELQQEYAGWKRTAGTDAWDAWMAQDLNNAHLALVGTYLDRVPAFGRLLARCENDLPCFYRQVENLAQKDPATRQACLENSECPYDLE